MKVIHANFQGNRQNEKMTTQTITKCCKIILGCETCVNSWYSGDDVLSRSAPHVEATMNLRYYKLFSLGTI